MSWCYPKVFWKVPECSAISWKLPKEFGRFSKFLEGFLWAFTPLSLLEWQPNRAQFQWRMHDRLNVDVVEGGLKGKLKKIIIHMHNTCKAITLRRALLPTPYLRPCQCQTSLHHLEGQATSWSPSRTPWRRRYCTPLGVGRPNPLGNLYIGDRAPPRCTPSPSGDPLLLLVLSLSLLDLILLHHRY